MRGSSKTPVEKGFILQRLKDKGLNADYLERGMFIYLNFKKSDHVVKSLNFIFFFL